MYVEPLPSSGESPLPLVGVGAYQRLQRSRGRAAVRFRQDEAGRTMLADLAQSAPCRALLPASEDLPTAVFATTSGGLASGDRAAFDLAVGDGAEARATTQAAERLYRARPGDPPAEIESRVVVGHGAYVEWLPQETILFDGACLRRRTVFELAPDARLLACELRVLGRAAHGEVFSRGFLSDRIEVRRDGRLEWLDILRLGDEGAPNEHPSPDKPKAQLRSLLPGGAPPSGRSRICAPSCFATSRDQSVTAAVLSSPAGFYGCPAVATVFYTAPDAAAQLQAARAILSEERRARTAATALGDVLIVRFLGESVQALRLAVAHFVTGFRASLGYEPVMPRFWSL